MYGAEVFVMLLGGLLTIAITYLVWAGLVCVLCVLAIFRKIPVWLRVWAVTSALATLIVALLTVYVVPRLVSPQFYDIYYIFGRLSEIDHSSHLSNNRYIFGHLGMVAILSMPFYVALFYMRNFKSNLIRVICLLAFMIVVACWYGFSAYPEYKGWIAGKLAEEKQQQQEEVAISIRAQEARDYFKEQCKKSGFFVYGKIEQPQASVIILLGKENDYFIDNEIEKSPKFILLERERMRGRLLDVIDYKRSMESWYEREVGQLLWHEDNQSSFLFVELLRSNNSGVTRFTPETRKSHQHLVTDTAQSRYGYAWKDVSTLEDLEHWVTRNQLKVIDMETNELVAERIAYMLDKYPGIKPSYVREQMHKTYSRLPRNADTVSCPANQIDSKWIKSILLGIPFQE
jgi:hypothetical protein